MASYLALYYKIFFMMKYGKHAAMKKSNANHVHTSTFNNLENNAID